MKLIRCQAIHFCAFWLLGSAVFSWNTAPVAAQTRNKAAAKQQRTPSAKTTPSVPSQPLIPELMTREKEMKMALSAGPEHLRGGAAVYVLEKNGFVKARAGTNGFSCIMNRDHPLSLKPTCFDAEGTATILPKVLRIGELLMEGKPLAEIAAEIQEGFKSGKYLAPRRTGVAYMLSGDIRAVNPATGATGSFPPHLMFYAPNVTNADIGTTPEAMEKDGWLPFIGYQGPHGYLIVVVGDKAKQHTTH
jgi:hypothetical protein